MDTLTDEPSELHVLGAIMASDAGQALELFSVCPPEAFAFAETSILARAMNDALASGGGFDPIQIALALRGEDVIQQAGGQSFIASLVVPDSDTMHPTNMAIAKAVADLWKTRQLKLDAERVIQHCNAPDISYTQALDAAQDMVAETAEQTGNYAPHTLDDLMDMRWPDESPDAREAVPTGITSLDEIIGGLRPGNLGIIAGRTGMGKSVVAVEIALAAAISENYKKLAGDNHGVVWFNSLEMTEREIAARFQASAAERVQPGCGPTYKTIMNGSVTREEYDAIQAGREEYRGAPLILEAPDRMNVNQIRAYARGLKAKHGLALIVVDYLQLIASHLQSRANRNEVVGEITKELKATAKLLNVPIIALAQIGREADKREDQRPRISELRESGDIEAAADWIVMVYRRAYYASMMGRPSDDQELAEWLSAKGSLDCTLIVGKNRHGETGETTTQGLMGKCRVFDRRIKNPEPEPETLL